MLNLRCLLLCFEAVLGLKINLSKSVIVPIGEVGDMEGLSSILGCEMESLPLMYLGLPLGAPLRIPLFGIQLLRRWSLSWQGGSKCNYPRVVD
jgi:hypothetical protein